MVVSLLMLLLFSVRYDFVCVRTYVRVELLNFQYEGKTRVYFYIILIELLASRFPPNLHAQNEHDRNSIRQNHTKYVCSNHLVVECVFIHFI